MVARSSLVPAGRIDRAILLIRGQKVMLDADLAALYLVSTRVLVQAPQQNREREYLLIAEDGENLRTRSTPVALLARGKFWVNNHAHIVRGNGEADTRFLMYALSAADISGYLTGSTMPKLTQGNMNRISLLAPWWSLRLGAAGPRSEGSSRFATSCPDSSAVPSIW
jgi:hypothetical protein